MPDRREGIARAEGFVAARIVWHLLQDDEHSFKMTRLPVR